MDSRVRAASKLPAAVRLPLTVILTLGLNALLYSAVAGPVGVELASASSDVNEPWQIGALIAWKTAGVAGAWYAGYDYQDIISLNFLANLPYYYLLSTFYNIHDVACVAALTIDILSATIPFAFLRGVNKGHESAEKKTANQQVAQDKSIYVLLTLFGAAITSLVVYGSFYTWLPTYMVVHFDGLRSVEKAHSSALHILVVLFIPIGLASTHFVFAPAVGSPGNPGLTDPKLKKTAIDPETATLMETLAWNVGIGPDGWTKRAEILAARTAALGACAFINTVVRVYVTVEGTELIGALGWASVWATATALTGLAFAWVGNE